jgi:hypothetical protein
MFKLDARLLPARYLISGENSKGYRMAEVNSPREGRRSERNFGSAALGRGEQPTRKNGAIPGLQRVGGRPQRVLPAGVLAEGGVRSEPFSLIGREDTGRCCADSERREGG